MKQKEAIPAGTEWLDKNIHDSSKTLIQKISADWILLTAGDLESDKGNWNTMTASWGGIGFLWQRDVAFIFIRPSRHTFGFVNNASLFTISFFDKSSQKALTVCGEKSGKDTDKAAEAGLTPVFFGEGPVKGTVSFKEATDIIVCKKLYTHDFDPSRFLDAKSIEEFYHGKDYHRMFVGEIVAYKTR